MRTGLPTHPHGGQGGTIHRWLLGGGSLVAVGLLLVALAQAPAGPALTLVNQSPHAMVVSVDGERVRTLRGGTEETLDLPIAIWQQPRTIEVFAHPDGPVLLRWRADLNDLADQRWRLVLP